jgi:hypothetical protein
MATAVRALFCSGGTGVFFLGSWREVAGMTVRKRTILVVVCGFGALRYMFFVTCPAGDWSLWEPTPVGWAPTKIYPWPVTLHWMRGPSS